MSVLLAAEGARTTLLDGSEMTYCERHSSSLPFCHFFVLWAGGIRSVLRGRVQRPRLARVAPHGHGRVRACHTGRRHQAAAAGCRPQPGRQAVGISEQAATQPSLNPGVFQCTVPVGWDFSHHGRTFDSPGFPSLLFHRPFVDLLDLESGGTRRLWESSPPYLEYPVALMEKPCDEEITLDGLSMLISRETPQEPPQVTTTARRPISPYQPLNTISHSDDR
jgi:hypothetical protein